MVSHQSFYGNLTGQTRILKKIRATILLCTFYAVLVPAQSKILNDYIEEGLRSNHSLKGAELDIQIQESSIEQSKKLWFPRVDLNASYLLATGGRKILFPVGDLFNPAYSTLNQLTGTSQFPTNLENFETQLTPNNFIDAQINASKPLINSAIKYNSLIQNELLALQDLNKDLVEHNIIFQIKTAYYNYLKSFEGVNTVDEGIDILNEVLVLNQKLVKFDKATIDAISDVQFRKDDLESRRIAIIEQQNLAKSLFNLLLNRPLHENIEIDKNIIDSYAEINATIPHLKRTAVDQRIEFDQMETSEKINFLNQEKIKKEKNPTLAVFAGIGVQTEDFNFDEGGPLYTTGLSLSMNIVDGGLRKKKLEQLDFERERIQNNREQLDQKVELEITNCWYNLKTIESQIRSQLSAVQSAEQSFNIIRIKYENDKVLLIELLQAQNRLTTSKIALDILKYDHLIKLAELDKVQANH